MSTPSSPLAFTWVFTFLDHLADHEKLSDGRPPNGLHHSSARHRTNVHRRSWARYAIPRYTRRSFRDFRHNCRMIAAERSADACSVAVANNHRARRCSNHIHPANSSSSVLFDSNSCHSHRCVRMSLRCARSSNPGLPLRDRQVHWRANSTHRSMA
jgi:hypothetical protein